MCDGLRQNIIVSVDKNSVRFYLPAYVYREPKFMKFWDSVGAVQALARLSMSHSIQQIFAIKSRSRQKVFWLPILREGRRQLLYGVWQSLVESRLLISVSEAWQ